MPYYIFCRKCNSDGSYQDIDRKCTKCKGTGNDWRDNEELEDYHKWLDVSLEKLKKEKLVTSKDGTKIFYHNSIPTIKEEQEKVIRFRPEPDLSQQNLEIAKNDLKARIKFFTKNFYLDEGLKVHSKDIEGEIDRVSLYISYVGIDENVLNRINEIIVSIEKNHANKSIFDIKEIPELVDLIELQEVVSHENFHLLQFLKCNSINTFYKASRKHNIIRYHLLSEIIRLGVKVKLNNENIFSSILQLDKVKIDYFNEIIKSSRMESMIVTNFYNYNSKKTNISIIDIFEGSAIAFQKLVNRSEEIETLYDKKLTGSKKYFGAWNYFKEQGGSERFIFFAIAYQSLKYGLLDDGDYMNVVPIPQDVFIMLCENILKYERKLNSKLFCSPFFIDTELAKLNLENEKITAIYRLVDIFNIIKEDIKVYSKQVNTYHDDDIFERTVNYNDTFMYSPIKLISETICKDYPVFTKDYFLPLLLVDYTFYSQFILNYLPKLLSEIEFKGISGNDSNIVAENFVFKLVDDVDEFIRSSSEGRSGFTYCCDAHKDRLGNIIKIDISGISLCESKDSLKNRYKIVSGKELESLFQWE